jgi:hypothetical protein
MAVAGALLEEEKIQGITVIAQLVNIAPVFAV